MALLDAGAGRLAELLVIACLGRSKRRGSIRDKKKPTAPMPDPLISPRDISHNPKLLSVPYVLFCFVLFFFVYCSQHARL